LEREERLRQQPDAGEQEDEDRWRTRSTPRTRVPERRGLEAVPPAAAQAVWVNRSASGGGQQRAGEAAPSWRQARPVRPGPGPQGGGGEDDHREAEPERRAAREQFMEMGERAGRLPGGYDHAASSGRGPDSEKVPRAAVAGAIWAEASGDVPGRGTNRRPRPRCPPTRLVETGLSRGTAVWRC